MSVRVQVNGAARELPDGATVATAVELLSAAPEGRGVAVAVAGEVVPRRAWPVRELLDGDSLEIVAAVGGG